MSKLEFYNAELEDGYNKPILNEVNHGTEELVYAYRDNNDKLIMITKNNNNEILFREFFHDYTVIQGVDGKPIVSSTIFANMDCIKIPDIMARVIKICTNETGEINTFKLNYSLCSVTNIAKNRVKLNNDNIYLLDGVSYSLLESFHLKEPYMSVYATADKLKLEKEIENLLHSSIRKK